MKPRLCNFVNNSLGNEIDVIFIFVSCFLFRPGGPVSDGQGEAVRHGEPPLVDSQEADAARGRLPGQYAEQWFFVFLFWIRLFFCICILPLNR